MAHIRLLAVYNPSMDENPYRSPDPCESGLGAPSLCEPGPTYAVAVHNDDLHTFAYVIETFTTVFGYAPERCHELAMAIHTQGRAIVWLGPIEFAELARDQIRSAGPDLHAAQKVDFPLEAVVEPLDSADAEAELGKLESENVQTSTMHTFCRVLSWGGCAVVLASWVDIVTPTVGWIGFAVAGAGWLLSHIVKQVRPRLDAGNTSPREAKRQ